MALYKEPGKEHNEHTPTIPNHLSGAYETGAEEEAWRVFQ